jgi:hypothetical protein
MQSRCVITRITDVNKLLCYMCSCERDCAFEYRREISNSPNTLFSSTFSNILARAELKVSWNLLVWRTGRLLFQTVACALCILANFPILREGLKVKSSLVLLHALCSILFLTV